MSKQEVIDQLQFEDRQQKFVRSETVGRSIGNIAQFIPEERSNTEETLAPVVPESDTSIGGSAVHLSEIDTLSLLAKQVATPANNN